VQSRDSYSFPLDAVRAGYLEEQYLDLLHEDRPDERSGGFDSLEEAIEAHEREFNAP
jgi:hypothetical protein